ncbi:uncharacterized protein BDZ99DRAFT_525818 [Mytilinidion resinicola]|uniref:Uncharacterized protein n=1 Tax=Mytilinidion resinicola TaxID=574789 RepID=A0A6A6Y5Y8_9PEZI|nr:uncharacterized protein BDZ99DRAFT_525818 [Mytilinidion resinicola]KAF2804226.1 hypothetical protein BDZ99DRAFT_525818 [Mytilinidion resinicola]
MEAKGTKTRSQTKREAEEKEKIDAAAALLKLQEEDARARQAQLEQQEHDRRAFEAAQARRGDSVSSQATIDDPNVPASFREGRAEGVYWYVSSITPAGSQQGVAPQYPPGDGLGGAGSRVPLFSSQGGPPVHGGYGGTYHPSGSGNNRSFPPGLADFANPAIPIGGVIQCGNLTVQRHRRCTWSPHDNTVPYAHILDGSDVRCTTVTSRNIPNPRRQASLPGAFQIRKQRLGGGRTRNRLSCERNVLHPTLHRLFLSKSVLQGSKRRMHCESLSSIYVWHGNTLHVRKGELHLKSDEAMYVADSLLNSESNFDLQAVGVFKWLEKREGVFRSTN